MEEKEQTIGLVWVLLGGAVVCAALLYSGSQWGHLMAPGAPPTSGLPFAQGAQPVDRFKTHALVELLKLVMAALIGVVVTAVHRRCRRKKPLPAAMIQAQILLAVSGALMMVIIGESVARAFGIAGAAAIIRFRTPVKDPKDAVILFLLMGLGMSAGLGAFAVAGVGTALLCFMLLGLDYMTREREKGRKLVLEVVASGANFPTEHVQSVFTSQKVHFEPREITHGKEAAIKYFVTLDPSQSLEKLSAQLVNQGASGIKTVSWEKAKKKWTL